MFPEMKVHRVPQINNPPPPQPIFIDKGLCYTNSTWKHTLCWNAKPIRQAAQHWLVLDLYPKEMQ